MQRSKEVDGVNTDVLIQSFADRILVLVTQLGKVGSLIQATIPATTVLQRPAPDALAEPSAAIELTPLLGSAPSQHLATLHALYVSQIATIIWSRDIAVNGGIGGDRRGVVVGLALKRDSATSADDLGLKEKEKSTFLEVMKMIQDVIGQ